MREGSSFLKCSESKPLGWATTQKLRKVMQAKGQWGRGTARGPRAMFASLLNLVHTFSNFDVDGLSHPELRERGDCLILLQGPVEEMLVALGKAFLLGLSVQGEVCLFKVDL